jgi:hypothetical protein
MLPNPISHNIGCDTKAPCYLSSSVAVGMGSDTFALQACLLELSKAKITISPEKAFSKMEIAFLLCSTIFSAFHYLSSLFLLPYLITSVVYTTSGKPEQSSR